MSSQYVEELHNALAALTGHAINTTVRGGVILNTPNGVSTDWQEVIVGTLDELANGFAQYYQDTYFGKECIEELAEINFNMKHELRGRVKAAMVILDHNPLEEQTDKLSKYVQSRLIEVGGKVRFGESRLFMARITD